MASGRWRAHRSTMTISLSLSFATGQSTSSTDATSNLSAGPQTPDDDELDDDFFSVPTKVRCGASPHLFSYYQTTSGKSAPELSLSYVDMTMSDASLNSLDESPTLPSSLSAFDIIGTLGRGSYGKVLLATTVTDGESLRAIKVIKKTGLHRYGREEIERELHTLGSLSSVGAPFLQNMVSSFSNDTFTFLVLEYHPTTLADADIASQLRLEVALELPASVSMPQAFAVSTPSTSQQAVTAVHSLRLLAAELVLALLFLHGKGIIHQDVKPANIMVSSLGHVVLGDFGASSWMDAGGKVFQPSDVVTFTPQYAAPELVHRNGEDGRVVIDGGVDWWSLGVVMYELATGGVTPFGEGKGRKTMGDFSCSFGGLERIAEKARTRDQAWWDPRLDAFVRALLVHDPEDRVNDDNVKAQDVFEDFAAEIWEDIAMLRHRPPLAPPALRHLDSDVGLSLAGDDEVGLLPLDVPMHDSMTEARSSVLPLPSSASIYRFCCTTDGGDPSLSLSVSRSLDISKGMMELDDEDKGHVDVSPPIIYRRPSAKVPFPSFDGHADVSAPYVYTRPLPEPSSPYQEVFSPRPLRPSLRRVTARRQLKRSREECDEFGFGVGHSLEESLTRSMLTAMERKSLRVEKATSTCKGSRGSKKSVVGEVFKRLRRFSTRSRFSAL